jgi:hypothetical protein
MAPVTALPVQGRHVALTVNPSGDVVAAEAQAAPSAAGGWWGAGEAALRSVRDTGTHSVTEKPWADY